MRGLHHPVMSRPCLSACTVKLCKMSRHWYQGRFFQLPFNDTYSLDSLSSYQLNHELFSTIRTFIQLRQSCIATGPFHWTTVVVSVNRHGIDRTTAGTGGSLPSFSLFKWDFSVVDLIHHRAFYNPAAWLVTRHIPHLKSCGPRSVKMLCPLSLFLFLSFPISVIPIPGWSSWNCERVRSD